MGKEASDYLSYLLRLWRVENHGEVPGADKAIWRVSLESTHTGERIGFATLNNLFVYLEHQIGMVSDPRGDIEEEGFK